MLNSIRSKTILILLLFSFIPLLVSGAIIYPRIWKTIQEVRIRELESIGNKQAKLVSVWMEERKRDAEVFARRAQWGSFRKQLNLIKDIYGYKEIFFANNSGKVAVSTSSELVGINVGEFDYFREAKKGKTFVSNIRPSTYPILNEHGEMEIGVPTLIVSSPVKHRTGKILGVICLRVDVMTLSRELGRVEMGKSGETYLVDKNGFMISESRFVSTIKEMGLIKKRTALELKLIDPETGQLTRGVQACLSGGTGYDAEGYRDYRGVPVLGFWHWLPEYQWGVISEIDVEEAYGPIHALRRHFFYIIAILLGVLAAVVFYVGRKIVEPIIHLNEATKKIAAGDYAYRVSDTSNDELGELADSFNSMARILEERECINSFNRIIASSPLTDVFDAAGNELKKLIDFDRFSITTFREKDDPFFLTFVLTKHHVSDELKPGIPSRKEGSLFEQVLSTGKPVIVPDTETGRLWSDKILLKEGIRSRMAYPLTYKGEIIGVANFGSKKPRNYSEKDFDILAQVAPQLAIVLENARIVDRIQTKEVK